MEMIFRKCRRLATKFNFRQKRGKRICWRVHLATAARVAVRPLDVRFVTTGAKAENKYPAAVSVTNLMPRCLQRGFDFIHIRNTNIL